MPQRFTLLDLVRMTGGWPIDLDAIGQLLEAADEHLPQGRNNRQGLTAHQLTLLGYDVDEPTPLQE